MTVIQNVSRREFLAVLGLTGERSRARRLRKPRVVRRGRSRGRPRLLRTYSSRSIQPAS